MGSSYKISEMSKEKYIKINSMSYEEIMNIYGEDGFIYFKGIFSKEHYDFGDFFDKYELDRIYNDSIKMFIHETREYFEEENAIVLTKEKLELIIRIFEERILSYYKKIKTSNSDKKNKFFVDKVFNLENRNIININSKNCNITQSFDIEYAIFELAYIYKTFDWDDNVLVFYYS